MMNSSSRRVSPNLKEARSGQLSIGKPWPHGTLGADSRVIARGLPPKKSKWARYGVHIFRS